MKKQSLIIWGGPQGRVLRRREDDADVVEETQTRGSREDGDGARSRAAAGPRMLGAATGQRRQARIDPWSSKGGWSLDFNPVILFSRTVSKFPWLLGIRS